MSLLVIILAVLLVHDIHAAYKLAGPYEIEILEVNECQDNTGNQFGFTTKLNKKSKSEKVWTTDYNLVCDFDNASKLVIDAEKWGSGGWQSNAFHHEADDICNTAIKDLPGVYNVAMEHSGIPLECPLKKGSYTLKEFPTKWGKQSKFPELPYGKYRAELKFLCSGEHILVIEYRKNRKKLEDIRKMIKHIPSDYLGFYQEILVWPTIDGEEASIE